MVFIQMVRKNCSIPLTLSLMVLSCSTGIILSAGLFIVEACSLALTSFFTVQFFCTEYYVHEAPCTVPDSREVYFE